MGAPSANYPWHWSIYIWIDGETINTNMTDGISVDIAKFLKELHKVDVMDEDLFPGVHNFYRGAHISIYTKEIEAAIDALREFIDVRRATMIWEAAISSKWNMGPVLVHGDMASGNILVKNGSLAAIIDFGCMGIGDPACDLVIAWTLLKGKSRQTFQEEMQMIDNNIWLRARDWVLWKALITLAALQDKDSIKAIEQKGIIEEL